MSYHILTRNGPKDRVAVAVDKVVAIHDYRNEYGVVTGSQVICVGNIEIVVNEIAPDIIDGKHIEGRK